MNKDIFKRTEILIGENKLKKLHQKTVAVFGLGGVGSYVVEGLVRAGIEKFVIIDFDKIEISNINRQILATMQTVGMYKTDVCEQRIKQINPNASVKKYKEFIGKEDNNLELFENLKSVDYIIDAIDTVSAKIRIIEFAQINNIHIISALGTGNKLEPTKLKLDNIYNTKICPLAKVIRKEVRKRGIKSLDVVYSEEEPIKINSDEKVIGSISYVPSVAGLLICSSVISKFINEE